MALFAIGDTHLSFSAGKPMDVFGPAWRDHAERLRAGFAAHVGAEDTVLLLGDLSWGMRLEECAEDFRFLDALPGAVKLIVKGNHDYWWTTGQKMERFFQAQGLHTLRLLHNSCWLYGDVALCGTRGWFLDQDQQPQNEKLLRRECIRLETSLRAAGEREKIVFLHYPTTATAASPFWSCWSGTASDGAAMPTFMAAPASLPCRGDGGRRTFRCFPPTIWGLHQKKF